MRTIWLVFLVLGVHQALSAGEQLSEYLWRETRKEQQDALESYFVQGIKNVSLDPIKFGTYLVQDALYLFYSEKSMVLAANKANDPNLKTFLLENAVKSYEKLYKDAFKDWHIRDPNGIYLGSACENYVNHLIHVAETMDPIYLVIACIPCENLWPWIGEQLGVGTKDFGVYNSWVSLNWNPKYEGYTEYERMINEAYREGKIGKEMALEVYRESMKGEVDFFNSVSDPFKSRPSPHDEF